MVSDLFWLGFMIKIEEQCVKPQIQDQSTKQSFQLI